MCELEINTYIKEVFNLFELWVYDNVKYPTLNRMLYIFKSRRGLFGSVPTYRELGKEFNISFTLIRFNYERMNNLFNKFLKIIGEGNGKTKDFYL